MSSGARGAAARTVLLSALALLTVALCGSSTAGAAPSDYGIKSATASLSTAQAGAHPDFTTTIEMKTDPTAPKDEFEHELPFANTKSIGVQLPPGLIGNPNAVAQCTSLQFATSFIGGGCPQDSQVGVAIVRLYFFPTQLTEPIFNMEAPGGDSVARLALFGANQPIFINVRLRSDSDYGLTATLEGIPGNEPLVSAETTFWGVPASPAHDTQRLTAREAYPEALSESPPRESGLKPEPFLSNPTRCGTPLSIGIAATSYQVPAQTSTATAPLPETTDCGEINFDPEFEAKPTSREAAAPSGLDAELRIPQDESVQGRATSALRDAEVRLPSGLTIAPGAADGLQACSADEVGYQHSPPEAARCPEASKIGSAEFDVPQLSRPINGDVYQRSPEPGNLFRIWLVTDELGVHVKIPGEVRLDPSSGQITGLFVDTPQVPVRNFKLHFKGGSRGVLATPQSCGTYQTAFKFTPWSGAPDVTGNTPMTIDQGCATGGFKPHLSAGSTNPVAARFTSFVTEVTRAAADQNLADLDLTLPPGVLAKLAGVQLCQGAAAASGDCPPGSQVGTTSVASGPGTTPLWIPQPGKEPTAVYLSGPYAGAPYSLVVKTPAQAGPFDLGDVVVRAAVRVDPETTRVTVSSDPLPQILEGVPISYRTVRVDVNRPSFALNPTSCNPLRVEGRATSIQGATAALSDRFQATGCARLGFEPKLALRLKGQAQRGGHPQLRAVLRSRAGDANIGRAVVALPHSEFLDQSNIGTVCTRVQFAADSCPAASVYGHAKAVTPLLDQPLRGPVYLRSSSHKLPDLVADLKGQVEIVVAGRIDSVHGGIRTSFERLPDAPVKSFVLTMKGGKKGLLENSRNICRSPARAAVKFDGQNGKVHDFRSALKIGCSR